MGIARHIWGRSEAADEVWKLVLGLDSDAAGEALAVALVAYIDDSRDPDDGFLVLGGHIATVENWALLSEEWRQLLPLAALNKNNRREFKMSEMMQTRERRENIQPFYRLIEKYVLYSISISFRVRDLKRAINRVHITGLRIGYGPLSNPYILAWRALMDMFHARRNELADHELGSEQIDFIFDEQSESRKVLQGWDAFVEGQPEGVKNLFGQMPIFRSSEKFMPLQAADLWAGWVRICEKNGDEIARPFLDGWKGPAKRNRVAFHMTWEEDDLVGTLMDMIMPYMTRGRYCYDLRMVR